MGVAALTALLAGNSGGQEIPGTGGTAGESPLRNPLEHGLAAVSPGADATPGVARPLWIAVFEAGATVGFSDNLFITPDVLGSRPVSGGVAGLAPRVRVLFPLSRAFGLVGDYSLAQQTFFGHGDARRHAARFFLGFRPRTERHVELGVRAGRARVSDFPSGDTDEGHVFLDGTWGIGTAAALGAAASFGIRRFPGRTEEQSPELLLGLIPLPGAEPIRSDAPDDRIFNATSRLALPYSTSGMLRFAYDFTREDSTSSLLDRANHRISIGFTNVWSYWLQSELGYATRFRGFRRGPGEAPKRRDTLHDASVVLRLRPRFLRVIPGGRTVEARLGYDFLANRSNVEGARIDRSFVSAVLEVGFEPVLSSRVVRTIFPGFASPPPSRSFSDSPPE